MSTSTYEQLKNEAADASQRATARPTANNHRAAASKHLAAAVHAKAIGRGDEADEHDEMADGHIRATKDCQGADDE